MKQAGVFAAGELEKLRHRSNRRYLEFLRVDSMSAGIYSLPAGARDGQSPHKEDEIYYVLCGRARMQAGQEDYPVAPGSIIFVAAGVEHRFYEIAEDLSVLVMFAPAESA